MLLRNVMGHRQSPCLPTHSLGLFDRHAAASVEQGAGNACQHSVIKPCLGLSVLFTIFVLLQLQQQTFLTSPS